MALYKTKEEALEAVKNDGKALCEVEYRFKDDEEIVEMAIKHGGQLFHASARLHNDTKFVLMEAHHKDVFDIPFDNALFCAKREFELCSKINSYYKKYDEFQIEMKLHYGEKYVATTKKYNSMSADDLKKELWGLYKKRVEEARKYYKKGIKVEDVYEKVSFDIWGSPYSLIIAAVCLRENGKPFSDIADHYLDSKKYLKSYIDNYCSRKISGSYPERVMNSLLILLGVDFAREMVFPWAVRVKDENGLISSKRYDFYIPSTSTIIEIHGSQHYDGSFESLGGRSLEEEQKNDRQKEELARKNGIKHYIVINAISSSLEYLKESITTNEEFVSMFDLTNINWNDVDAGTVYKVKTDIKFPLYEEMVCRSTEIKEAIKTMLIPDDYVALKGLKSEDNFVPDKKLIQSLERNVKLAYPSARGLYPHEILLLKDAHYYRFPLNIRKGTGKWYYQHGIVDVNEYYNKLLREGFVRIGDLKCSVEHSTVPEIKRVLSKYGFPTIGRKAELVDLVLEVIPHEDLEKLFPNQFLDLTETGILELQENAYLFTKNSYDLSIWTLNKIVYAFPNSDIDSLLREYRKNPRRFLKFLSNDERQSLGIIYTEGIDESIIQCRNNQSNKENNCDLIDPGRKVDYNSTISKNEAASIVVVSKDKKEAEEVECKEIAESEIVKSKDETSAEEVESNDEMESEGEFLETNDKSLGTSKNKRIRWMWLLLSAPFLFFGVIFLVLTMVEPLLIFATAFFGVLSAMFIIIALSPKDSLYILGYEKTIRKKNFVFICILVAFIMPIISNLLAS